METTSAILEVCNEGVDDNIITYIVQYWPIDDIPLRKLMKRDTRCEVEVDNPQARVVVRVLVEADLTSDLKPDSRIIVDFVSDFQQGELGSRVSTLLPFSVHYFLYLLIYCPIEAGSSGLEKLHRIVVEAFNPYIGLRIVRTTIAIDHIAASSLGLRFALD